MLEQISYIDDCDTLGQKAEQKDIHRVIHTACPFFPQNHSNVPQALVLVYQKILEFYKVALDILSRNGARMVMEMALDNDRLPNIVQDFLRYSDTLRKLVQKATWEIVEDIKSMLYDHESKSPCTETCCIHSHLFLVARWLGRDKMSRQSQYHVNLQDLRADNACDFLLKNPNFINWYHAPDSQQLVIIGDMGCGKTVAMAYLVDEISRMNECLIPQPKTCYYYCRDDETGNAVSIYSGLILSLLQQLPGLKKPFFEWYKQAQASGIFDPATNIRKLADLLQNVLEAIERPVFIVIDGLDECDPASRNSIFKLLGTLSQNIPGLKTILSCRPQEEILNQLDGAAKMELRSDPQRDAIIVQKTVERQLFYLSTDVRALVIDKLSRLAQGNAIWTKMTVELIEVRKMRAFEPMQRFLKDIPLPRQLSKLYATLLSRYAANDPENQEFSSTALKLLAATHRPLSILELAWAVALGMAHHVTTVDALSKLVDHERVMSLILPFIARVDSSDVTKRQVRLTHQSVKEFIIDEWTTNQGHQQLQDSALAENDHTISHLRFGSLEAFILDICIRYLLLEEIGNRDLFSEEQVAIAELPQESDLFNDNEGPVEYNPYCTWETWEEDMICYDPTERGFGEFFVYASSHWLEHFSASTVEPLPSLANITDLCQAGSTQLHNWTQQNCRPGCAITARFDFHSSLYDPLSITALYGSDTILRDMLANSDFEGVGFLPQSAMRATEQILQWGDVSRLGVLFLADKLGHQLQNLDFFQLVIKRWHFYPVSNHDTWESVFDLVKHVSDKMVQEQWGNELLCVAAGAGCMPIIRRLMDISQHKTDLGSELLRAPRLGPTRHESIGEAVMGNHLNVVKYLLGQTGIEGHLRYRNARGENVLHLAARICNPYMFGMLIPRFQEGVFQEDDQGYTPLMRMVVNCSTSDGWYESAKVLLRESSTGWKGHSGGGEHNPLRTALDLGDLNMGHVLISTIDPDM